MILTTSPQMKYTFYVLVSIFHLWLEHLPRTLLHGEIKQISSNPASNWILVCSVNTLVQLWALPATGNSVQCIWDFSRIDFSYLQRCSGQLIEFVNNIHNLPIVSTILFKYLGK